MQMIKYQGKNFFKNILNKIKSFFTKKQEISQTVEVKSSVQEIKNEEKNIQDLVGCKMYKPTPEIIELVDKFEVNGKSLETLTNEQIKELIEYYQEKNKELDREITYKKKKFNDLAKKLNDYYEKAKVGK